MSKTLLIILVGFLFTISTPALSADPKRVCGGISNTDPTTDLICQVCEFRQMFCGGGAVALITICVVFVGILTLMNKINWGFVLVMAAASIIFVNADKVAFLFTGEDVECSC
jgi:type IV secretory pathway VirB2 component (pilin)